MPESVHVRRCSAARRPFAPSAPSRKRRNLNMHCLVAAPVAENSPTVSWPHALPRPARAPPHHPQGSGSGHTRAGAAR